MIAILAQTPHPINFEDFPPECDRSVKGALRLHPGGVLHVTAGELAALQSAGIDLRVLAAPAPSPQTLPLPAAADDPPVDPAQARKVRVKGPKAQAS